MFWENLLIYKIGKRQLSKGTDFWSQMDLNLGSSSVEQDIGSFLPSYYKDLICA